MSGIRFGMQLPIQAQSKIMADPWEPGAGPAELARVAQAADRLGYDYVGVCDHVAIPRELAPRMTTTWYDTVATLSWLAGQTERVRLASTIFVAAYRHPLTTAKAFSTLDALSGGRAVLGIGAGHVAAEFAALGIPFAKRGVLTNQAINAIRASFDDEWAAGDLGQAPRPVQPGGPPIWIGGSMPAALRRAAEQGDGWLPQGAPEGGLGPAIDEINRRREDAGRADRPFAMGGMLRAYIGDPGWDVGPAVTGKPDAVAETVAEQAALGVTHLQVKLPARALGELLDQMEAFATEVMPLVG